MERVQHDLDHNIPKDDDLVDKAEESAQENNNGIWYRKVKPV